MKAIYVRYFALLLGVAFLLAAVGAFLPIVSTDVPHHAPELKVDTSYRLLLGLFPVNVVHNLVHLSLGVLGVAAYRNYDSARLYAQFIAILLTIFVIMGFIEKTGFGVIPLFSHDIWLHGLEAIAAGYLGFVYKPSPAELQASASSGGV